MKLYPLNTIEEAMSVGSQLHDALEIRWVAEQQMEVSTLYAVEDQVGIIAVAMWLTPQQAEAGMRLYCPTGLFSNVRPGAILYCVGVRNMTPPQDVIDFVLQNT